MRPGFGFRLSCLLLLLAGDAEPAPPVVRASQIEVTGILGNSGVAGDELVRINTALKRDNGSGLNSGVYLDRDWRVWTSGGDAFICLTFDGRLVRRYPLEPAGSRIDTPAFAALDDVLYALGHLPKPDPKTRSDVALFALPLSGAATAAVAVATFPEIPSHQTGVLCPTPHAGQLLMAFGTNTAGAGEITIETYAPGTKARTRLFSLPGNYASALATDPAGEALFVGGYFGKYVGGNRHQPNVHEILKVGWDGAVQWRRECLETPANPTLFRGLVSHAGGALWDSAHYGFMARFDLNGKTAPGKVASWDMRIPYVSQVLDVRRATALLPPAGPAETLDPVLLANHSPEHTYLAVWDDAAQVIELRQRYGSLPDVRAVTLSTDGWVNASTEGLQFWWQFADAANTPPRFANHSAACTPGVFRGEWVSALAKSLPITSRPALGRGTAQRASANLAPFAAVGYAVDQEPAKPMAYATDGTTNGIWRATMDARTWAPAGWKLLMVAGGPVEVTGDIAVLGGGRVAVADHGAVALLELNGDGLKLVQRIARWGNGAGEHFGGALRLAADGANLIVADTVRHRVLWFDARTLKLIAQAGQTDGPGTGVEDFDRPSAVALAGANAVVYDAGNQRLVKLLLTASKY